MKRLLCLFGGFALGLNIVAQRDLTQYVDPFIGTAGHGHTHPAAVVPHGMVQPGPDTCCNGWDACSGYHYSDRTVNGFTQTRLSGTGCGDMADFLLLPYTGQLELGAKGNKLDPTPYASPFSHADEVAAPGYYATTLQRYDVRAEMTATQRTALYRFTYPAANDCHLLLDLYYHNQEQWIYDVRYRQVDSHTLCAYRRSQGWAQNQPTAVYLEFSKPFEMLVVTDSVQESRHLFERTRLLLHFNTAGERTVMVRLGLSYVDEAGARANLYAEQPAGFNFEGVRAEAVKRWNEVLSKVEITKVGAAAADSTLQIFYTALYHAALAPTVFSDVDGRYLGMDGLAKQADPHADAQYTVFSLWDTHRALHPLVSILNPEMNVRYIKSLMRKGEEFGVVPKWELTGNETACMIGYHYTSLLADMVSKGYTEGFDLRKAYRQAVRCAEYDTTGISRNLPRWKMEEVMPEALRWKCEEGIIPCDKTNESVAKALEYAYNDWCIAEVARVVGDAAGEKKYRKLADAYRHYFDPATHFMRGRTANGGWREPFCPTSSDHRMDDYTEGNAWQWTWFVPHDPDGLCKLFGGRRTMLAKLDSLFVAPSVLTGDNVSPDISGLIGQYAHGNEPSHSTIFLYSYLGQPRKTQALADSILRTLYTTGPEGLSGNEDCGQMSAWYILNALGFYQFCPGRPEYVLSRPLFAEAILHLSNGKNFTIRTRSNSPHAKYVKTAYLNGKRLKQPFFTHAQLEQGGELLIEMEE